MKNPITTIGGSILIILSALTLYGVITEDQAASIGDYATIITEAIIGLIGVFVAKDKGGGI